jgi:hypothetical protein
MAISRAQLVKELLPGLDELFAEQYRVYRIEQGTKYMSPETKKLMGEIPLQVAYDLWTVAFGDAIDNAEFYEKVEDNEYLKSISQYLYECKLLKADPSTSRYYLTPFPKTVQPCKL